MTNLKFDKAFTALLVIDPYNNFISEGGQFWDRMRNVAEGMIATTCLESTVRFAAELGYEVTVVKDAIADSSDGKMRSALDVNLPNYANAIVTTPEVAGLISSLSTLAISAYL